MRALGAGVKMLSLLPGEYGRKTEAQRNWRGSTATGGACGLIGFNAVKLTGGDGYMKAKLMTLPNFPRGGAWPSSVRTVRRSVESDNEQDPYRQIATLSSGTAAHCWDR